MLRPQRDSNPKSVEWNPKSVESKVDALNVRLWGLLKAFPFLFCCSECLLKCTLTLDATCRLTLSIFYFISDDGFVNSFFRSGALLGSSTSFWQWIEKVRSQRDSNTPLFWFEVRGLIRWTMRPGDVFANSLVLQLVTWVRSKVAQGAGYRLTVSSFFFARNWCLLSSSLVCLVKAGRTDGTGSFSFVNHDWNLRATNWNLRPQRVLNPQSSHLKAGTPSVRLGGLSQLCFVTVNELAEV